MVLEELRKLDTHPTAGELYEIVRQTVPNISLGTVYRNLDQLVEVGLVKRLPGEGGRARFDGDVSSHHHVRCIACGRVSDVHGVRDLEPAGRPKAGDGFRIIGINLEFTGVCPDCAQGRE